ncbi:MAG: Sensor kinase CckA [Chloroflexi bacterium]|nr:Sensor kinase CckA [Chloroflexota bacterium]
MRTHPLYADVSYQEGWNGAILGLPLLIGDRTVGVMNIAYNQPREFQASELRVLKLLSDQVAIAVENARLFEQVAVERRRLRLLYDTGQKLVASLNIDSILSKAIELVTLSLGGKVGIATLYNVKTKTLKIRGIYGRDIKSPEVKKVRELNMGEGIIGWVAENREAVYIPDVRHDDRWTYFEGIDHPQGGFVAAPVLSGSSLLGVLSIQSDIEGVISEEHLDLLEAICQQVGLALSNAQRYQDVNRLVDRLAGEQHRKEALIEGLPIGVLLLTEDYRLELINTQGKKYLKQLSSAKVGDVIAHLGPYSLSELIARSEEPLPVDIVLEKPPKKVFELQMRSVQNNRQQWVVTLQDVTVIRTVQDRTQMQTRLATVGQLAAGIGHDFNNIMAAILVYTELLLQEQNLPLRFEKRLHVIKQQIERASELIHQMLDFSRSSVMEETQIDLLPFLKELEKLLERTLPETIKVTLRGELGEYFVNVDPTRMQQVFMNLAVNARDAMPEGGELSFEISSISYRDVGAELYPFLSEEEWAMVTVSDTGTGIPENIIQHIFEPFFTTKEVGKGTGLGLAQVYGIIQQFDGHIEVKSTEGVGTTFTVFLPMVLTVAEDDTEQIEDVLLDGTGRRVLLVEDDPAARQALKSMLEMFDYQVVAAANGLEALEHLQAGEFYFVVSDIVMPEMGGVDLYYHIQAKWPDIKVLFVTGHPLHGKEKKLLEKEGVFWLQKPFTIQKFIQIVEDFFEEEKA